MARRRATVQLTDEDLHYLLALEPGERVVTAWPDPLRDSIVIGIEGDETTSLPETIEGAEAYRVERPYAMAKLRDQLIAIMIECRRDQIDQSPDELNLYYQGVGMVVEAEVFPHLGVTVPEVPADGA